MRQLTGGAAERLVRRALGAGPDGSRGLLARRAWRRVVRACAAADPAVQDAVRGAGSGLSGADVLELLAAAPEEPAERAAYLALIGQSGQREALDPDGSLLALAYRAAAPAVRSRLRAVLAAEGDSDVVRVVVAGDRRDRFAEMPDDELDYLGRQFVAHERWDDLRRLALDLPPAKAVAVARLLPAERRTGEAGAMLETLADCPPGAIGALLERLPRQQVISYQHGDAHVSFSPDQAELAVNLLQTPPSTEVRVPRMLVETIRLATGEVTPLVREQHRDVRRLGECHSILHTGGEIIRMKAQYAGFPGGPTSRIHPVRGDIALDGPEIVSNLAPSGTGIVAVTRSGLAFIDRGSNRPRHVAVPRLAQAVEEYVGDRGIGKVGTCHLATLPSAGLIAVTTEYLVQVFDEQGTVRHELRTGGQGARWITFLGPAALGLMPYHRRFSVWDLSKPDRPPRTVKGGAGWPPVQVLPDPRPDHRLPLFPGDDDFSGAGDRPGQAPRALPLDPEFALLLGQDGCAGFLAGGPGSAAAAGLGKRKLLAVSPYGDMVVTVPESFPRPAPGTAGLQVHSPHLPSARTLLEAPLLHATPQQLQQARKLRKHIGDPGVRAALDLFVLCLEDRFGGEIALGGGTGAAGGPHDIALGTDGTD